MGKRKLMHLFRRNVLLLYKRSAYSIYLRKGSPLAEINRYKKAHDAHLRTLAKVERILNKYGIKYSKYVPAKK